MFDYNKTHFENLIRRNFKISSSIRETMLKCDAEDVFSAMLSYVSKYGGLLYEEFIKTKEVLEICDLMENLFDARKEGFKVEGELIVQFNLLWQMANFIHCGKKAYKISDSLSKIMLATELKGVRCRDLKLPFNTIYIIINPSLGFTVSNYLTGLHEVYGVYLTKNNDHLKTMICGAPQKNAPKYDDALSNFSLDFGDENEKIENVLEKLKNRIYNFNEKYLDKIGFCDDKEIIVKSWNDIFLFVMNFLMYLTHSGTTDIENIFANDEAQKLFNRIQKIPKGKRKEILKERLSIMDKMPRIIVGRRIKNNSELPRNVKELSNGRKLLKRILVSGHWQRFHVGKRELGETVWKFREPHWRGEGEIKEASIIEVR